jgi:chromosome segregation ATPase
MTLNYSIIAGVLGGAFCTFVLYYLTAYRRVRRSNNEKEVQLMQLKTECEELSNTIFHMETQRQMDQQNASKEKTQLLSELQQIRTDKTNLENQYAKDNTNWNKEWETKSKEIEQLHTQVAQLTREKNILETRISHSAFEWEQQGENLKMENDRLQAQVDRLTREKADLTAKLEDLKAALEQERLGFDVQLAQSQDLTKKLECQLHQVREQKNTVSEQENSFFSAQILQLESEKMELEQKLRIQSLQTQALEAEIKQLMERLLQIRQVYHTEGG